MGRFWIDPGKLFAIGCVMGIVTLAGVTGIYANIEETAASLPTTSSQPINIPGESSPPITTSSGVAEIFLARHLAEIGAKKYGAYWCPHCHEQKEPFGLLAECSD